jgi:hypothetical protein
MGRHGGGLHGRAAGRLTPGYQGLPGGVCQCPHYGYVFTGRMRAVYPGTDWPDEIAEAGDVYFFPAGHSIIYDEPSEVLELNPAAALQALMNHFEAMMASGWSGETAR